jgi:O-antigen ligase
MIWLLGGYIWLFVHRPFEYWPWLGDLQVERVYMLLLVLAWLVVPGKGWVPGRMHWGVLAYYFGILACWVVSPYREVTGQEIIENISKVAVFYLLLVTLVRDEKSLRRTIVLFIASVGVYLLHSLLEYANGRLVYRMGVPRLTGVDLTLGDPNAFAATMVFSMPLTLPLWYDRPGRGMQVLLGLYTLGSVVAVLLTGSRSGFIGMCACGLAFILLSRHRKVLLLLAAVGAVVAVAALPDVFQNRILTLIDSSYGPQNAKHSADSRWVLLARCVEVWQERPFTGWGPGTFLVVGGKNLQAHNVYGQVLAELGLLGLAVWAVLLVMFAWNMVEVRRLERRRRERSFSHNLCLAVCLSVLLMLLMGLSGHNLFRYFWLWFAAFQTIAVHCVRQRAAAAVPALVRVPYLPAPRRLALGAAS